MLLVTLLAGWAESCCRHQSGTIGWIGNGQDARKGCTVSMLGHYLNKAMLVSIPAIFGNAEPRLCQLVGIEPAGLWLESEDLRRVAFPDAKPRSAATFVPFTQIAYVVGAPSSNASAESAGSRRRPSGSPSKKSGKVNSLRCLELATCLQTRLHKKAKKERHGLSRGEGSA